MSRVEYTVTAELQAWGRSHQEAVLALHKACLAEVGYGVEVATVTVDYVPNCSALAMGKPWCAKAEMFRKESTVVSEL